jgi:hypothetical protein
MSKVLGKVDVFWIHWYYNHQTRLSIIFFSDRVRRDNISKCRGRKDHEGKTSGPILHGVVFTQECALLVLFRIHDMKKYPADALGTLRNTGIHALVSPKCGTSWVMPGPEFESSDSSLM